MYYTQFMTSNVEFDLLFFIAILKIFSNLKWQFSLESRKCVKKIENTIVE